MRGLLLSFRFKNLVRIAVRNSKTDEAIESTGCKSGEFGSRVSGKGQITVVRQFWFLNRSARISSAWA